LVLVVLLAAGLLALLGVGTYDTWGALLVGSVIVAASVPALLRQASREGDRRLLAFLLAALAIKLVGAVVRHYVAFDVYEGAADAAVYHEDGTKIAERFRAGDFDTGLSSLVGEDFMAFLTGIVYTIIGPTRLGGFLVFSWLGFWGLFMFYRAFVLAVPEGRKRTYALLVFFLPSLVFWPSSIGKEAWMTFALGMAAFGAARLLTGKTWRGMAVSGLGLWLASLVRPHVAGLVILALAAGFLVRRSRPELRQLAPIVKGLALAGLAVVAVVLVARTDEFLRRSGFRPEAGFTSVLSEVGLRTEKGGSGFDASVLESPGRAPIAVVTVLFRPFLAEAHNAQALAAACESTLLLLISMFRFRWIVRALTSMRRQPYVAFAVAYGGLFILAFSSIANFGILARERVQLLPLYLVLLSIRPPDLEDDVHQLDRP
jgi:hypothetical protein